MHRNQRNRQHLPREARSNGGGDRENGKAKKKGVLRWEFHEGAQWAINQVLLMYGSSLGVPRSTELVPGLASPVTATLRWGKATTTAIQIDLYIAGITTDEDGKMEMEDGVSIRQIDGKVRPRGFDTVADQLHYVQRCWIQRLQSRMGARDTSPPHGFTSTWMPPPEGKKDSGTLEFAIQGDALARLKQWTLPED
jgi:hypothetical protein